MEKKSLLQDIDDYLLDNTVNNNLFNLFNDIKTYLTENSIPVELPVKPEIADDSNKIKWFMELAIKMYDTGYCDASIYSIDTDAWDEYRVNDKLTPSQAIAEEESNG